VDETGGGVSRTHRAGDLGRAQHYRPQSKLEMNKTDLGSILLLCSETHRALFWNETNRTEVRLKGPVFRKELCDWTLK
jgi:hypothetical protein